MELDKDFFKKFKYEEIDFKGEKGEIPAKYFDTRSFSAIFPASSRKLKKYLPTKKMKLIKPFPGISFIFVVAYEYKHISALEPYNEIGIGYPLKFKDKDQEYIGSQFIHLPVTTERARELGADLFGYPKFVADITFEDYNNSSKCILKHEGNLILTLEVPKTDVTEEFSENHSFTVKDNKVLRTRVTGQGFVGTSQERGIAKLILGTHPISQEIKKLLLINKSFAHTYTPKRQTVLPLAEEEYDF
ncbi:MAG: acetoacetate decarboxylase family protein [Candidatus Thorarchaeota archaeon]